MIPGGDHTCHALLMGTFSLLLNLTLKYRTVSWGRLTIGAGSVWLLFFSTIEEFSQLYMVHRAFDLLDLGCNILGILCADQMVKRMMIKRSRRRI